MAKDDDDLLLLGLLFLLGLLGKFKIPIIIPPEKDKDKDKEPTEPDPKPEEEPEPYQEPEVTPQPTPSPTISPIFEPEPTPQPEPTPDIPPVDVPTPIEEPEPTPNPFYTDPESYGIPTPEPATQPYPDVEPDIPMIEIPPWTQLTLPFSITPEEAASLAELGLDVGIRATETSLIAFATGTTLTAAAFSPALFGAISTALVSAIPAAATPELKKKVSRKEIKFKPDPIITTPIEEPEIIYHKAPSWKWGL